MALLAPPRHGGGPRRGTVEGPGRGGVFPRAFGVFRAKAWAGGLRRETRVRTLPRRARERDRRHAEAAAQAARPAEAPRRLPAALLRGATRAAAYRPPLTAGVS